MQRKIVRRLPCWQWSSTVSQQSLRLRRLTLVNRVPKLRFEHVSFLFLACVSTVLLGFRRFRLILVNFRRFWLIFQQTSDPSYKDFRMVSSISRRISRLAKAQVENYHFFYASVHVGRFQHASGLGSINLETFRFNFPTKRAFDHFPQWLHTSNILFSN